MNSRSSIGSASSRRRAGWIDEVGFEHLDVTHEHALVAGRLDPKHRDPFDRLLMAQALVEGVEFVSNEELFDGFGVRRLW
jgi:PIN domain nuclease of toxin-antitoxin system